MKLYLCIDPNSTFYIDASERQYKHHMSLTEVFIDLPNGGTFHAYQPKGVFEAFQNTLANHDNIQIAWCSTWYEFANEHFSKIFNTDPCPVIEPELDADNVFDSMVYPWFRWERDNIHEPVAVTFVSGGKDGQTRALSNWNVPFKNHEGVSVLGTFNYRMVSTLTAGYLSLGDVRWIDTMARTLQKINTKDISPKDKSVFV